MLVSVLGWGWGGVGCFGGMGQIVIYYWVKSSFLGILATEMRTVQSEERSTWRNMQMRTYNCSVVKMTILIKALDIHFFLPKINSPSLSNVICNPCSQSQRMLRDYTSSLSVVVFDWQLSRGGTCALTSGTFHAADMKERSRGDGCSTPASLPQRCFCVVCVALTGGQPQ